MLSRVDASWQVAAKEITVGEGARSFPRASVVKYDKTTQFFFSLTVRDQGGGLALPPGRLAGRVLPRGGR